MDGCKKKMLNELLCLERFWQSRQPCSLGTSTILHVQTFFQECYVKRNLPFSCCSTGQKFRFPILSRRIKLGRLPFPTGMGTEFAYAINLLAGPQGREAFLRQVSDDERGLSPKQQEGVVGNRGEARILEFMGEPSDEHCLESIRRKMQMQEDTFRKQVRELHRLYGTQKKIMGEMRARDGSSNPDANYINWPCHVEQTATAGYAFHLHRLNNDQGLPDMCVSGSREAIRNQAGLDLEIRSSKGHNSIVDEELSHPNFSAPGRREAEHIVDRLDEESDVELTLSIGRTSSRRKPKSCSYRELDFSSSKEHSTTSVTSDHKDACNSNASNTRGSSTSDQERRWPLQLKQM